MNYWLYSLGMPLRVSGQQLSEQRKVRATTKQTNTQLDEQALANSSTAGRTDSAIHLAPYLGKGNNRVQAFLASHIMSSPVFTIPMDMTYGEVWKKFKERDLRHVVIVDKQLKVVGILSDRDLLGLSCSHGDVAKARLNRQKVGKLMTTPVLTATPQAPIKDICKVMFNQHIGAIPIIDDLGTLKGIITRSDILRAMIKHGPLELWI